jgi:hypothetical protein
MISGDFNWICVSQDSNNSIGYKLFVYLIGFYVTPTQYGSYGDVHALPVGEDLRCPSVHYFRHKQNHRSFLTWNYPKSLSGLEPTAVRGKWFEVNDLNH